MRQSSLCLRAAMCKTFCFFCCEKNMHDSLPQVEHSKPDILYLASNLDAQGDC